MSKTWRDGYVLGKAKKIIHLDDEVARALEIRAAEEQVTQTEIVERELRKELGIMAKTYMCYTCNGDFETGYWLSTGEGEELFYCDEHAKEAGVIDSEHSRRQFVEPKSWQLEDRQYISDATWETVTLYGSLTIRREGSSWIAEVGSDDDTQARLDEAEVEETGAGLRTFWEEVVCPVALDIAAAGYEVAAADGDYTIYLRIRDNEQTVYVVVDSENASITDSDPAPFPNYDPVR